MLTLLPYSRITDAPASGPGSTIGGTRRSGLPGPSTGLPGRGEGLPPHLAALRDRMRRPALTKAGVLPFGDERIDACLPGQGLPLGQLHEIGSEGVEAETATIAAAFTASLAARIGRDRPVFWITPCPDLHPPGLLRFGLDPARLVMVRPRDDTAVLGAMEAVLRDGAAGVVVGEVGRLDRVASRRLHFACQKHAVTGFALRRFPFGRRAAEREATASVTRWRLSPAPSLRQGREPGPPRWRAALTHARGGRPGEWLLEAAEQENPDDSEAPHPFRVVAELAGHAAEPSEGRRIAG